MFGLCLFCPLFILYRRVKGAGSQQAVKSGLGTMHHWDVLVFTANGCSLFIKIEAGSACSNTLPTPQCGCYFLIAAAWNFCSCLPKPPHSVYEIWLLGKHCLTAVSLTRFFHPAIVGEALRITMTTCSHVIKCMCMSVFRALYIMLLLLALVSEKCGVTQYNDSVLHVISYGALRNP